MAAQIAGSLRYDTTGPHDTTILVTIKSEKAADLCLGQSA
jgi:hypothetical protein